MKRKVVLLIMLVFTVATNGQWQKIGDINIGIAGQIIAYGPFVYYYGNQAGFKLYRFDENGDNFTDLTSGAGEGFSYIYGFEGKLYGCWLSTFYTSEDNGVTWKEISTVSVTGSGAVLKIVNDGETLYGVSNRKSIFKSIDKGITWEEIIINDPANVGILNFAVSGDVYFVVSQGLGGLVSKDAGQTWTVSNVSPSITISNFYNYNGKIFTQPFYNGLFFYDFSLDTWSASSSGLPGDGVFYNVKSMSHVGSTIYLAGSELIGSASSIYTSSNEGGFWVAVGLEGTAALNAAGSTNFISVNTKNIFYYYYGLFDAVNIGFYKLPNTAVTAINQSMEVPTEFNLSQNYPNPFNPSTKINFSIPDNDFVSLKVFNTVGEEVKELVNQNLSAGSYTVDFNAGDLSSGVYFYTLKGENYSLTKKLLFLK